MERDIVAVQASGMAGVCHGGARWGRARGGRGRGCRCEVRRGTPTEGMGKVRDRWGSGNEGPVGKKLED
jgi:hypothetical protein